MISTTSRVKSRPASQFGKSCLAAVALAFASFASANPAHAGATVSFGEDKSISLGLGMRTSFQSVEDGNPKGSGRSGSAVFSGSPGPVSCSVPRGRNPPDSKKAGTWVPANKLDR